MASEAKLILMSLLDTTVLILVLVEDGFRELEGFRAKHADYCVLILVLVEDGFRALSCIREEHRKCLNPCSCGRWL